MARNRRARSLAELFPGEGEMWERVREHDWPATLLGPVETWPEALVSAVRLALDSRYPMFVAWGPELLCIYNDGFVPILGARHPDALGSPLRETWADAWPRVAERVRTVMEDGRATWDVDFEIITERNGFPEETYFTYSYSPLLHEGRVGGLFCACEETTQRILRERRDHILRRFAAECVGTRSDEDVWNAVLRSVDRRDQPFAFFYRCVPDGGLQLAGSFGLDAGHRAIPETVSREEMDATGWPFQEAERAVVLVEDLTRRFGPIVGSAWPEPVERALLMPISSGPGEPLLGFGAHGISPRAALHAEYRGFIELAITQFTHAIASARITAQVEAAEERLRLALEASQMVAWDWNLETGAMLHVGDIQSFYEMRPGERFDAIEEAWQFVHEEDREGTQEAIQTGVATGRDYQVSFRLRPRGNEDPRWIEARGSPYPPGPDGEEPRWVHGVCIDVTERKRVEEILRQDHAQKDRFLATLGHELRNPLAALDGALALFERGAVSPESIRHTLTTHVHQLTMLVNDLLEVARIARGKLTLRKAPVSLAEVVCGAIEAVQQRIDAAEQRLTTEVPDDLVIEADATRLQQVITNLLANATQYTPTHGSIALRVERRGGEVEIRVEDTGSGMSHELIQTAFEPFAQADVGGGGLGIGLSLVRGLVELHGGTVHAESEGVDRGSCFLVRLPVGALEPAAPEAPPVAAIEGGLRVLIVDDLRDAADSLAILLRLDGCETFVAYTGEEGLTRARELKPDVILLDIGLPDRSGYEIAKELQSSSGLGDAYLVAVTGYGDEASERKIRQAGFDERLVKPVERARLRELLAVRSAARSEPT